jgi:hypothetical protein
LTVLGNVLLVVAFSGVMTIMAILAALMMAKLIINDIEEMYEQTYIVTKDGEKILYNEEDQE